MWRFYVEHMMRAMVRVIEQLNVAYHSGLTEPERLRVAGGMASLGLILSTATADYPKLVERSNVVLAHYRDEGLFSEN